MQNSGRVRVPGTIVFIFLLSVALLLPETASALMSFAEKAGVWEDRTVEREFLGPDGTRTMLSAAPVSGLALGHLDEDGVIDLVVLHSGDQGAFAAVSLGDPRFRLGPKHDLDRLRAGLPPEQPFHPETRTYPLAFTPHWAAVGDWNADGFFDLVVAAEGVAKLQWLAGDGTGRLGTGGIIPLEGPVTAFLSQEVNRRDGLEDLILGVIGSRGPAVLVFESARGALMEEPERHGMPARVTSLAADWLDGRPYRDIAAAAGEQVVLISGRDRKLVLSNERRAAVPKAAIEILPFNAAVLDIAVGYFVGEPPERQVAVRLGSGAVKLVTSNGSGFKISDLGELPTVGRLLSARAAGLRGHDLIVHDPGSGTVKIVHAEPSKNGGFNFGEVPTPAVPASYLALGRLNRDTRDDLVLIARDDRVQVAASMTRLALVVNTSDDTDDGTCDATHCSLREAINYANALPAGSTITFSLALGDWTIEPTSALPQWTQIGASSIDGSVGSFPITGRVTISGASAGSGQVDGLDIAGANTTVMNLHVRGFSGVGIHLGTGGGNCVTSCLVGLDETGDAADPNGEGGIKSEGDDDEIGGTAEGEGNIVSGNLGTGIEIYGDDTLVRGNRVGTNIAGDSAVGNDSDGIFSQGLRTVIGSALVHGGNLSSGNFTTSLDYGTGITVTSNSSATQEALIIGNIVGLSLDGTQPLGNEDCGILANSNGSTIGGIHLGNVIAATPNFGNWSISGSGIAIGSRTDIQILGNFIGTDPDGTTALGNEFCGITVDGCSNVIIGGETSGAGNVISGNEAFGINFENTSNGEIYGNLIGVAADGVSPLGNERSGIRVWRSTDVTIGSSNAPNHIAYNTAVFGAVSAGIVLNDQVSHVTIGPNSIHDNKDWLNNPSLGIDLGQDHVTANDTLDEDTGPNGLQNYPVITAADALAGTISFSLHSSASGIFKILLFANTSCDGSGYGEGETCLGEAFLSTDGNGNGSETANNLSFASGQFITATATSLNGDTSEFSMCFEVPASADLIFADGFESGALSDWDGSAP